MIKKKIFFHADDYGITLDESKKILKCFTNGSLNSLSIFANGNNFNECVKELEKFKNKVKISIHLNLVEGYCCSNPKDIQLLVDSSGKFKLSFEKMLFLSYTKQKKELSKQIYIELETQINKIISTIPFLKTIRLDSHQHFHMIPLVFDCLLNIIKNNNLNVEYIRIPTEPIIPFLKKPKFYLHYKPINWIKNILLNVLGLVNIPKLKNNNINTSIFFGLIMTGNMDIKYVSELLPYFIDISTKRDLNLEVLFHPGSVDKKEEFLDITKTGFVNFYTSDKRIKEKEALCSDLLQNYNN